MRKKSRLGRLTILVLEGRLALPVLLGLLSLGFSLTGWISYLAPAPDMGWPLKLATAFGRTLGAFVPDGAHFERANVAAKIGASFGMLATATTGTLLALTLLGQEIFRFRFRFLAKGHHLVVGDSSFARRIASALQDSGLTVVQAVPEAAHQRHEDHALRLPMLLSPSEVQRAARASKAAQIIIDLGPEEETLVFAKQLGRDLAHTKAPPQLLVNVGETNLVHYFAGLTPAADTGLRADLFCQNELIARQMLAAYPLFLQAAAQGQPFVHALVIGFGDLGENIFDQIMLTSLAGDLLAPKITLLDVRGDALARNFAARRPHVLEQLGVTVIDFNAEADIVDSIGPLAPLMDEASAITAIFVTLATDAQSIRVALMLRAFQERTGKLKAPIFFRCREDSADALSDAAVAWPCTGVAMPPLIRLGMSDAALVRAVLPSNAREQLAQRLHATYTKTADTSLPAHQPWPRLAETYRRANVRAADHLAAKLWTLGVPAASLCGLDPGAAPVLSAQAQARIAALTPGDPQLLRLAALEHGRWMIDRQLDGWRYGSARDNAQRLHPMLVDWTIMRKEAQEVAKDEALVLESLRAALQLTDIKQT
jgi:hypothetical protein